MYEILCIGKLHVKVITFKLNYIFNVMLIKILRLYKKCFIITPDRLSKVPKYKHIRATPIGSATVFICTYVSVY